MVLLQQFFITVIIAIVGGLLALKLKVPAGAFVGAMLFVAVFNICFECAYFPSQAKMVIQSIAGAFIALKINHDNIKELRHVLKPALVMVAGMLFNNIVIGFAIYRFTFIDMETALFSATPGGLVDMVLICSDYGANASYVALMQLTRLLFVVLVFPPLMVYLSNKFENPQSLIGCDFEEYRLENADASYQTLENKQEKHNHNVIKDKTKKLFITFVLALAGGAAGYYLGIPAGALVVSMVVISVYNVLTDNALMPLKVRRTAQICSGALIGMSVTRADILALKELAVAVVILLVGLTVLNLALGFIIFRISRFDLTTSLFATAPAGVTDMALIADDIGADSTKVSVLHIIRLISAVSLFPMVIIQIIHFFG